MIRLSHAVIPAALILSAALLSGCSLSVRRSSAHQPPCEPAPQAACDISCSEARYDIEEPELSCSEARYDIEEPKLSCNETLYDTEEPASSGYGLQFRSGDYYLPGEDFGYRVLSNAGRVYFPYGAVRGNGIFMDFSYAFGDYLGCADNDPGVKIYALAGESSDEWIIEYYTNGIMDEPVIFREMSCLEDPHIPACVESFENDYWN